MKIKIRSDSKKCALEELEQAITGKIRENSSLGRFDSGSAVSCSQLPLTNLLSSNTSSDYCGLSLSFTFLIHK